jgi:hypothetical protein
VPLEVARQLVQELPALARVVGLLDLLEQLLDPPVLLAEQLRWIHCAPPRPVVARRLPARGGPPILV